MDSTDIEKTDADQLHFREQEQEQAEKHMESSNKSIT